MKTIKEMTFEELVEYAEGYVLKELIKGNFHDAIYNICIATTSWCEAQNKKRSDPPRMQWKP